MQYQLSVFSVALVSLLLSFFLFFFVNWTRIIISERVSVVDIRIPIGRAYAEPASSVKLEEELHEEEVAKDMESDSMVESGSSDEEAEDGETSEGKKKKQRVGFRDRKVIDDMTKQWPHHLLHPRQIYIPSTNGAEPCCLSGITRQKGAAL